MGGARPWPRPVAVVDDVIAVVSSCARGTHADASSLQPSIAQSAQGSKVVALRGEGIITSLSLPPSLPPFLPLSIPFLSLPPSPLFHMYTIQINAHQTESRLLHVRACTLHPWVVVIGHSVSIVTIGGHELVMGEVLLGGQ